MLSGILSPYSYLPMLIRGKSRSISAENPTGEKGRGATATTGTGASYARDLGPGWKISPSVEIPSGATHTLADIQGPGAIQSMWLTGHIGRDFILRIYWENQDQPSVECPLSDFFALPWISLGHERMNGPLVRVNSIPISVNPNRGLNSYWPMPFQKRCRITLQNLHPSSSRICYYQINYMLGEVPDDCGYFHAQFRQINPLPFKAVYTILDGIAGRGHYVGTSMGWSINNNGWWGEGEIKFFLDGDKEYPTICGTGVEDYFGGAYCWKVDDSYVEYSAPFLGMHQVIRPDGAFNSQHRHSMYRWHILDPIIFDHDIAVTIQALGWRPHDGQDPSRRYLPGQHWISSIALWYQTLPSSPFPLLPSRDELEII